jgi:hypothetical protein
MVHADFEYELSEDPSNPSIVGPLPMNEHIIVSGHVDDETNSISSETTLDLGEMEFSKVGDYKFILREIGSSDEVNYPVDENHVYYIYAYVRNEIVNNEPTGNLIATLVLQAKDHDEGEKTDIVFSSQAVRTRIEISKSLTGSAADTNKYFKFVIKFNDDYGERYTISGQDDHIEYDGIDIFPSEYLEVTPEGRAVYLKHGQTVTIGFGDDLNEIPIGAVYSIEEVSEEGYVTSVDGVEGNKTADKTTAVITEGVLPASNKTWFINHRDSEVLTGVTVAVIPAVAILAVTLGGFAFAKYTAQKKSKR